MNKNVEYLKLSLKKKKAKKYNLTNPPKLMTKNYFKLFLCNYIVLGFYNNS